MSETPIYDQLMAEFKGRQQHVNPIVPARRTFANFYDHVPKSQTAPCDTNVPVEDNTILLPKPPFEGPAEVMSLQRMSEEGYNSE